MSKQRLPRPGLDGTYRDTCIGCYRGTDTAVGIRGRAEWHLGFFLEIGIPMDEARPLCSVTSRCPVGKVPVGEYTEIYRLCQRCAERAGIDVSLISGDELPCYIPASPVDNQS
jgi:hypothetical protein